MPISIKAETELGSQSLLEHLREAVVPKGKKSLCLRDCSDKQLLELYYRLRRGATISSLVRIIQTTWTLHRTMPERSIAKALTTYKKRTLPLLKNIPEQARKDPVRMKQHRADLEKGRYLRQQLDAVSVLRWAVAEQAERVADLRESEKDPKQRNPLFFKDTRKEFDTLGNLAAKLINVELELGILDRAPTKLQIDHKAKFDVIFGQRPDNGQALIEAAGMFLEEAEKNTVILTRDEDGKYSVEPTTEADKIRGYAFGICGGIGASSGAKKTLGDDGYDDFSESDTILPGNGD